MVQQKTPVKLIGIAAVCAVLQAAVQFVPFSSNPFYGNKDARKINPSVTDDIIAKKTLSSQDLWKINYAPKGQQVVAGISPDQMLLALSGMREMIASILWVRADSFFDDGDYDAVLPIIRIVTWLDPKQIDVFSTGMWHIGYNFTDNENRSDRRYIPTALALGAEGAAKNPETYEMFFECGWMWYHKINDIYPKSVGWMEQAQERADMLPARKNVLAMAYQRSGQIDKALDLWYSQYDKFNAAMKANPGGDYQNRQLRDTAENNIDTMLVRMAQRGVFAKQDNLPAVETPYDTQPPFDVGFSAQVTVPSAGVIRCRATWNVRPVGTRIRVVLRDADYPNAIPAGMKWDYTNDVVMDPPKDLTFMQDELFVKNHRSYNKMDLSRDPTMYPFKAEKYVIEFYYNPRSAPPHIQDKFGWTGDGMTDQNFLNNEVRPGEKVVYARLEMTRDQLLREGAFLDKVPVVQTKNYVEAGTNKNPEDEVIQIPSLLAEPNKTGGKK